MGLFRSLFAKELRGSDQSAGKQEGSIEARKLAELVAIDSDYGVVLSKLTTDN